MKTPRRRIPRATTRAGLVVAVWLVLFILVGGVSSAAADPAGGSLPVAPVAPQAGAAAPPQRATPAGAAERSEFERWYEALPRVTLPVPSDGAAVVIVKFSDLQCPACSETYVGYRPILAKYQARFPGAIKFITKDYPLQPECNSHVMRPLHSAACDAAVAVRLAAKTGKHDALEEWFYTHQALMSPATVREVASSVGGVSNFDGQYAAALAQVKADIGLGGLLGIRSTPTFFINGVRITDVMTPQTFDLAVAYELRKAGKMK
jgi:protein-disulfide isomerase